MGQSLITRCGGAIAVAVLAVLLAPAAAVAAPIEVDLTGDAFDSLRARSAIGDRTDHDVTFDSVIGGFRIRDTAGAQAGAGCGQAGPTSVVCAIAPEDLDQIFINGAGGDDEIEVLDLPPAHPDPDTGLPVPNVALEGRFGNDTFRAGSQALGIKQRGGPGDDLMYGTTGTDALSGGPGRDRIFGLRGGDSLKGEDGPDLIVFGPGRPGPGFGLWGRFANLAFGGPGNDRIYGRQARDDLHGGTGSDRIFGRRGEDRLLGGRGPDRLISRDGRRDQISCGAGNDRREHTYRDRRDIRPYTLRRRNGRPVRLRVSC
jgi:Ca2+-binding RTX toxin-like protein